MNKNGQYEMHLYVPKNSKGGFPGFEKLELESQRWHDFNDYIAANNLKEAYSTFKLDPKSFFFYYLHNGRDSADIVIGEVRRKFGLIQATKMNLSLERLIKEREKMIERLKNQNQEIHEQCERDSRIDPDIWHIQFDV